jgi:hypothetical protein
MNKPTGSEQADLALATFPRKTKKSGDFSARKPGEPSVTNVTRKSSSTCSART